MSKARVVAALALLAVSAASLPAQDNAFQAVWQPGVRGAPASGAVVMGQETNGDPLYVCRGQHQGGTHPGKYIVNDGLCHISWGGHAVRLDAFELLVRIQGEWGAAHQPGRTAYAAGTESGQALTLCRANHGGGLHPGKLVQGKCNIAFADAEVEATEFTVFYASAGNEVQPSNEVSTGSHFSPDWRGLTPADDRGMLATATPMGADADGPLYACRVESGGDLRIGATDGGTCRISSEGEAMRYSNFWLLYATRGEWGAPNQADRWTFAPGTDSAHPVVLCRALHGVVKVPGRLAGRTCQIVDGYQEADVAQYELFYRPPAGAPAVQWATPNDPANAARGAVVLGTRRNGQPAHACRVRYEGGVFTGEYDQERGTCRFARTFHTVYAGGPRIIERQGPFNHVRQSTSFEILTLAEGEWVSPTSLAERQAIFLTGNIDGIATMLCRVQEGGATHIGWAPVDAPTTDERDQHVRPCYFYNNDNLAGVVGEVFVPIR